MRIWLIVSLVVTLAAAAASTYLCFVAPDLLPESMPTHWNIHNEVDATMPRDQAWKVLFLMPGAMALFMVLTLVLPWLSPRTFSPERFRATYYYIMGVVVLLFGYLHAIILVASTGRPVDIGRWILAGMFLFFAVLGNVLGKVRRNFYVGIRTPWTLASEQVWNRTHRFGAWIMVVAGVVGFIASLAGVSLIACFVGLLVACLTPVFYSLILYKHLERTGQLHEEVPEVSDPVA
jgi:uncharacterized membrane protein